MAWFVARCCLLFLGGMALLYVCDLCLSAAWKYAQRAKAPISAALGRKLSGAARGYSKASWQYGTLGMVLLMLSALCFARLLYLVFS